MSAIRPGAEAGIMNPGIDWNFPSDSLAEARRRRGFTPRGSLHQHDRRTDPPGIQRVFGLGPCIESGSSCSRGRWPRAAIADRGYRRRLSAAPIRTSQAGPLCTASLLNGDRPPAPTGSPRGGGKVGEERRFHRRRSPEKSADGPESACRPVQAVVVCCLAHSVNALRDRFPAAS